MIYLIIDILFYSLSPFNTSFYLFYLLYQKDYLNILSIIIIIYLTHNLFYLIVFLSIILFKRLHYLNISNKFLKSLIVYLIFFNLNITLNSFIIFILIFFYFYYFNKEIFNFKY